MAQRNSASANDPAAPAPDHDAPRATAADPEPGPERRRAAAYIDLWERQLTHTAAQATPSEIAARKGPKAGG